MNLNIKTSAALVAFSLLGASLASGANATFSVFDVNGDSDVLNDGTTLLAANYGGNDQTINGISFSGVGNNAGSPGNRAGEVSGSGVTLKLTIPGEVNSNINGDPPAGYGADLAALFDTTFLTNSGGSNDGTIEISGLTVGTEYRLQLFGAYQESQGANRGFDLYSGFTSTGTSGSVVSDGVIGKSVTATWIADSTFQDFFADNTFQRASFQGAVVSVIPEPGSFALISGILGLGFVALQRRRA